MMQRLWMMIAALGIEVVCQSPSKADVVHTGKWAHPHHAVRHNLSASAPAAPVSGPIDPAGLCRGVISRSLTQWGSDVSHFHLNIAAQSPGVYLFRLDDDRRAAPWRQPAAHGECLTSQDAQGKNRVDSFSLGAVADPATTCQAMFDTVFPTAGMAKIQATTDAHGIVHSLTAQGAKSYEQVVCPLTLQPDGVYRVANSTVVQGLSPRAFAP